MTAIAWAIVTIGLLYHPIAKRAIGQEQTIEESSVGAFMFIIALIFLIGCTIMEGVR